LFNATVTLHLKVLTAAPVKQRLPEESLRHLGDQITPLLFQPSKINNRNFLRQIKAHAPANATPATLLPRQIAQSANIPRASAKTENKHLKKQRKSPS
jgi:UDP-N-acetylglucosamine 2-epimerase